MTAISAGATASYTFTAHAKLAITLGANERCIVTVLSGGRQVYSDVLSSSRTIGPFDSGAVATMTAYGSAIDYEVTAHTSAGAFMSYTGQEAVAYSTNTTTGLNELDAGSLGALTSSAGTVGAKSRGAPAGGYLAMFGDSYAGNAVGGNVGGLTLTRSNNIVTVAGATSHPTYPGGYVTVVGCASLDDYALDAPVRSRVSSSSLTYYHEGPDGVIAAGAQSISVLWKPVQQSAGFFSHFNRLSGGGFELATVACVPGAQLSVVAAAAAKLTAGKTIHRAVFIGGYNDLNAGAAVATTVASVVATVNAYPSAFWDVFTPGTFNSGAAANTAANLRTLQKYYAAYKEAFAGYPNVRVHNTPAIMGASTGLSSTGMTKSSDNVHPSFRGHYALAKYLAALDGIDPTNAPLPLTALDTIGNDATSKNVVDNPLMTGTGGSITNVTGTFPTGTSGQLLGTGASGTSALNARSDGFGNDWTITYTPANADNTLRASYSMTVGRFANGDVIDTLVARLSITGFGTSNAANIKNFQIGLVFSADGVDYVSSIQECSSDTQAATHTQQEDVTDVVVCLRNLYVPTFTSLTLARIDITTSHYASSATPVVVKIAQLQVKLQ